MKVRTNIKYSHTHHIYGLHVIIQSKYPYKEIFTLFKRNFNEKHVNPLSLPVAFAGNELEIENI